MTRPIIKHGRVRLEAAPTRPPEQAREPGTPEHPRPAKAVRLLERDGRVHAVELTCSCGEVTVLELDYDGAESPA